jgi:hypothetical protein
VDSQPADAPTRDPKSTELYDQPWMQSVLRPLLVAIMAACLALALLAFVRRLAPDLPAVYSQLLVTVSVIAAITGTLTTTWLAQPGQRGRRNIGYRTAELALILMVTRLAIWLGTDAWPGFEQFFLRPVDALLDGYFLVGLFVVGLAWLMATSMTEDQLALGLQPDDIYMARTFTDRWQDTARPVYTDRPAILRRFVARWVVGGILLVIFAAGSRFELPESGFFGVIRQGIDPVVIGAIIVYFLCGLALISQGQLALLRARWTLQKTPSADNVLRNWPAYALLLIVAIALVAALMPLGGTFRLAQILTAIITGLYFVIFGLFRFILSPFLLLIAWLTGDQQQAPPPPPPPVEQAQPEALPPAASSIPPWAGGALFWLITALLLGYAAYIYFSGKGFTFGWARRFWQMLTARWALFFGAYREWQAARVRDILGNGGAEDGRRGAGLPGWLRLRHLDPARQIRYYYLATLHRAAEAGLPRHEAETPLRYAPRLAAHIAAGHRKVDAGAPGPGEIGPGATGPGAADDEERQAIAELTEAFVQVRYAGAGVTPGRLARAKAAWEQIKRLLRL